MGFVKTGNPIPTAPVDLVQGYLDCMANKALEDGASALYKSGYDLATLVKEGKAEAPSWAIGDGQQS